MMDSNEKYLGIVKWYGTQKTLSEYGFISIEGLGDIFVHSNGVLSHGLKTGDVVSLKLRDSRSDSNKLEAYDVELLTHTKSLAELVLFLDKNPTLKSEVNRAIRYFNQRQLENNISYPESDIELLIKLIRDSLHTLSSSSLIDQNLIGEIVAIIQKYFIFPSPNYSSMPPLQQSIILKIIEELDDLTRFSCWLLGFPINFQEQEQRVFYDRCSVEVRTKYLFRYTDQFITEILLAEIELVNSTSKSEVENLIYKLVRLKPYKGDLYEYLVANLVKVSNLRTQYILWQSRLITDFSIELEDYVLEHLDNISYMKFGEILRTMTKEERSRFMGKAVDYLKSRNVKQKDNFLNILRENCLVTNDSNKLVLENIIQQMSPKLKIDLWLKDQINLSDYNLILENMFEVDSHNQVLTTKKLFWNLKRNNIKLTAKSCNTILESKSLVRYDLTVLLVFYIVRSKLIDQKLTHREIIIFIILKLIGGSKPKLESDFFEKCTGRTILSESKSKSKQYSSIYKTQNIPYGILFCEGRKALSKTDKKPVMEKGFEFYWCRNKHCFQNAISIYNTDSKSWEKFTLFDVLKEYTKMDEESYSFILGVLNKFNNYLSHLKCRHCKEWLMPLKQSNFGVERVNTFHCNNNKCPEFMRDIYISYCLNSKCTEIIDSRVSAKCSNGWYICHYCLACCNTQKILSRKRFSGKLGGTDKGSSTGHNDLGNLFCYKCGAELSIIESVIDKAKYEKSCDWLSSKVTDSNRILNHGITKTGKKWYLVKRTDSESSEKFKKIITMLYQAGFQVRKSDSNPVSNQMREVFFVSERNNQKKIVLKCGDLKCGEKIDLDNQISEDYQQIKAMTYHRKIDAVYGSKFKKNN